MGTRKRSGAARRIIGSKYEFVQDNEKEFYLIFYFKKT
jgi:hypothetical protein